MDVLILLSEAVIAYGLVLGAHAFRHKVGLTYFYALIGSITAIMSWVTDAGVQVQVGGVTFLVGSTVFYTSLLLGVFVVYVFDGPRATRVAIYTVVGISIMMPLIALILNFQMTLVSHPEIDRLPTPSFRINTASVLTTLMDLVFLAVAWELLNKSLHKIHYGLRAFATLLGVMWLDVLLFNTGAFIGSPNYWKILQGTLYSRFIISLFAAPILAAYLIWENQRDDTLMEQRPILAILQQLKAVRQELSFAHKEIERRKKAEKELEESRKRLEELAMIDDLTRLYNRRSFRDMAKMEILKSRRYKYELTLLMIDLDRFKTVNDNYGHETGDQVLTALAETTGRVSREIDISGRLGGEEFAILLPNTDVDGGRAVAERFRLAIEKIVIPTPNGNVKVTVSIGVSGLSDGDSLDVLLKKADLAMYEAKRKGRNRVEVYSF